MFSMIEMIVVVLGNSIYDIVKIVINVFSGGGELVCVVLI